MWCVRERGERTFGNGYHLTNSAEAYDLCAMLNANAECTEAHVNGWETVCKLLGVEDAARAIEKLTAPPSPSMPTREQMKAILHAKLYWASGSSPRELPTIDISREAFLGEIADAIIAQAPAASLTEDREFIKSQIEYAYDAACGGLPRHEVVSETLDRLTSTATAREMGG